MSEKEGSTATAIAHRESSGLIAHGLEWQAIREQAAALIRSKFYPRSVDTPEKVIAIMLTGRELGIPPMQAVRSIHVVDGRPTIAADLMLALAYQRIPGIQIIVTDEPEGCAVTVQRPGGKAQVFKFGKADATAAGLTGKDNWRKYPKSMYRARAISAAIRAAAPDAILGLYTPEEIESLEPAPKERNITAEAQVAEPEIPDMPATEAVMNDGPPMDEAGSDDGPEPPPKAASNGGGPTGPQISRLWAIAHKAGRALKVSEDEVKKKVVALCGVVGATTVTELTRAGYDEVCKTLEAWGKP